MSNMLTNVMIVSEDTDSPNQAPGRFILSGLHLFDQMKVVLEQSIYLYYLKLCSCTTTCSDFRNSVIKMRMSIPNSIHTSDISIDHLYESGIGFIDHLLHKDVKTLLSVNPASELYRIFLQKNRTTYYNSLYTATMTKALLDEFLAVFVGYYDAESYPEGMLRNAPIYRPSLTLCDFRNSQNEKRSYQVAMTLSPIVTLGFDFNEARNAKDLPSFIGCFNLINYTVDEIIGLYASFSIDHDKYVIANSTGNIDVAIADICFDMVTGSSYVSPSPSGSERIVDLASFKASLFNQIKSGKLQSPKDSKLFGDLLSRLGENCDLVNYFVKDINHISAQEAFAFRKSMLASIIKDRFVVSMEADDETAPADDTANTGDDASGTDGTDTTDDAADTGDASPDLGGTDELAGGTSDPDDTEDKPEKVKPQIDPDKMLLELSNPQSEPMTDYVYREIVAQRISNLIKQPPRNARPNDIVMLKRWKSRWLYLASIACLRDFLARVSLRLSN